MSMGEDAIYKVVRNDEEQYSIWPANRANPAGWTDAGKTGTADECLSHIDQVWTDLRPRSVRERMAGAGRGVRPGGD